MLVDADAIRNNKYDLSISRYKPVEYKAVSYETPDAISGQIDRNGKRDWNVGKRFTGKDKSVVDEPEARASIELLLRRTLVRSNRC